MLKYIKRLIRKRKAISPVIATILLIALTVTSISIVYFIIVPFLNKSNISAFTTKIKDTDKDSRYDLITLHITNTGTKRVEITSITIWTVPKGLLGSSSNYEEHTNWEFKNVEQSFIPPSDQVDADISGTDQIELTIEEETFYYLEIYYSESTQPFISDWRLLNDQADFSDLISDFESFDLQAWGFEGTIDVPGWPSNNYKTTGGPEHGPLLENQYIYLPVINETDYVKFYITGKIVIFHSRNGNLTSQPTMQQVDRTSNPFKARKIFILGLAGSWGDEFPAGAIALTLNITYTDGTSSIWGMGHDYIDDWWYPSNPGNKCISAPAGKITEIDLGTQIDSPYTRIHTHTAGFTLNFYKYIQYITFIDPGNDNSGPHLLSLTCG